MDCFPRVLACAYVRRVCACISVCARTRKRTGGHRSSRNCGGMRAEQIRELALRSRDLIHLSFSSSRVSPATRTFAEQTSCLFSSSNLHPLATMRACRAMLLLGLQAECSDATASSARHLVLFSGSSLLAKPDSQARTVEKVDASRTTLHFVAKKCFAFASR